MAWTSIFRRTPEKPAASWVRNNPLFIYQMGKVGSTSIHHGVLRKYPRAVHTHSHADVASFLAAHPGERAETLIVTGIRDLLKRNISAFFQTMTNPANPYWHYGPREAISQAPIADLIAHFERCQAAVFPVEGAIWFDRFAEATGIDVYGVPFEREKGYQIYAPEGGPKVFLYRLEDLDAATPALKEFLKGPRIDLSGYNVAENKWYAEIYTAFKAAYRPDEAVLSMIYDSRPMRHFYSDAECEGMKAAWRKAR